MMEQLGVKLLNDCILEIEFPLSDEEKSPKFTAARELPGGYEMRMRNTSFEDGC